MHSPWREKLIRYRTPLLLVIYFANYPLLYLMNVLLSRWLGAADYGDFSVARSVGALGATLALFGLDRACLQYLPFYTDRGERRLAKGFIYFGAAAVLLLGTVLSVVGYGALEFIRIHMGADEHPMVQATILIVPMSFVAFLIKLMAGQGRATVAAFANQILLPLVMIGLLSAVFVIRKQVSDFNAIKLLIVGYALIVFLLLFLFGSIWRTVYQGQPADFHHREWIYRSSSLLITSLVLTGLSQSGMLVLEALHDSEEAVGLFAAVRQVALFPLLALGALNLIAVPELSVLLGKNDMPTATLRLGFYLRVLLGIGLASLVAFVLWGGSMLALFNSSFRDGHTALLIMGVGYLVTLIGGLTVPILQILGDNRFIYISMSALLVLNVALSIALIPTWGPTGAALAYTLSVLVIYGWQIYWLQKHSELDYLASILGRGRQRKEPDSEHPVQVSAGR